ncbi:FadR/GntR family transcriptional regulator [Gordonia soli]|uniref:Putative GntR family transcriptional regulator n=1 Tax=Gordonia soli NBRC 108243 TaxID=1223545 RepID=M0QNM9_9ACTN|nr:FadR/GntR family transcriptional regulator [Gordonia soli]GAC70188.1 putative GntR family transcriptional regulator [Gordonia soli NBRC 108243]
MTHTVQRQRLATQAAEVLLGRIQAEEWALGHKLPGETVLAAQLGVGRSTLREAIRELAGKGVVESRQGAGIFVIALEVAEDWDAVVRRASIVSVIEARIAIETEAASLAAQRRTPADVRAMRRALAHRGTDTHSIEDHVDADMALHRSVVAAAHNDVLLELFDGFIPRIRQAMIDMLTPRTTSNLNDDQPAHAAVIQAIAGRDPHTAAQLSRAHLEGLHHALG